MFNLNGLSIATTSVCSKLEYIKVSAMFPSREDWQPLTVTDSSFYRVFFQSACDVPELEEKFNIDEYSDMVTLSKPIIYISVEEIINTHSVNPLNSE